MDSQGIGTFPTTASAKGNARQTLSVYEDGEEEIPEED
jgi:hypothetical protein